MSLNYINFDTKTHLFEWACDNFLEQASTTLKHKNFFDVALSGGATAQEFFKFFIKKNYKIKYLDHIRFFVSDERVVDLSNSNSNAGNAWRILLKNLSISIKNFFPLYDDLSSPEQAAAKYEKLLRNKLVLNEDNLPSFDLIYLGLGQDGHTASLFPHHALLKNLEKNSQLIAATKEELAGFRRLTFMPRLINAAQNICMMAAGAQKEDVLNTIINGPLDTQSFPAQLVIRDTKSTANVSLLYTRE